MKAYHRDVYLPESILRRLPRSPVAVRYTDHAIREAERDRYGCLRRFLVRRVSLTEPVEVRVRNGKPASVLVRYQVADHLDLCMALAPGTHSDGEWVVITVWGNSPHDKHTTLRRQRYEKS